MNQLEREEKLAQALKMAQQAEEKARQTSEFAEAIAKKYHQRLCKTVLAKNKSDQKPIL
jgi:hypothetical protein